MKRTSYNGMGSICFVEICRNLYQGKNRHLSKVLEEKDGKDGLLFKHPVLKQVGGLNVITKSRGFYYRIFIHGR